MIRVLVVDDHTLVRQGIVGLLQSQPDIEVVAQAGSGAEALAAVAEAHPDVVLMDIAMPGLGGLDATREIRARFPEVQVVILTIHDREDYLFPGATKRLVADYVRRARSGEDRQVWDGLSDREREILTLIAQGMTTPDIAAALYISPHTVQSHRDHIMTKLGLHSKAALIRYAISRGLIEA